MQPHLDNNIILDGVAVAERFRAQYVFQYCRGFESRSRRHELSSKKSTNIEGDDTMIFSIIVVSGIVAN